MKKVSPGKRIGILFIKYLPSLLAITCSLKIWLLCSSGISKDSWCYIVNWINWALNILVLLGVWCLGREFGFCWKHRSLCRIAAWGYAWYGLFLVVRPEHHEVLGVSVAYVVIVTIITVLYKEIK